MKPEEKFMRLAIKEARKNLKRMDGGPFGACIVRDGKVIAVARNTVLISDASAHAEVNAIRLASKRLKDFVLTGCVIYSTTEPCPMCFSAIHWGRLDAVIYGTTVSDAKKLGFNELQINCKKLRDDGASDVEIYPAFLRRECLELFNDWKKLKNKRLY